MILDFKLKKEPTTGRGLYATRPIKKGSLICECPLLTVPKQHQRTVQRTPIIDYTFDINGELVIPLGYGGLFNHSFDDNVVWATVDQDMLEFRAGKDILPDEQLFINYGYNPVKIEPTQVKDLEDSYDLRRTRTVLSNKFDETILHRVRDWASTQPTPWTMTKLVKQLQLKKEPTPEINYLVQDEYLIKVGDSYAWLG